MRHYELSITLQLSLTADDWQLYDTVGREMCAETLNRSLEAAVKTSKSYREAWSQFGPCLKAARGWGAADSEGVALTDRILQVCYGDQEDV